MAKDFDTENKALNEEAMRAYYSGQESTSPAVNQRADEIGGGTHWRSTPSASGDRGGFVPVLVVLGLMLLGFWAYDGISKWIASSQASMKAEQDRQYEEKMRATREAERAEHVSSVATFYFAPDAKALAQLKQFAPYAVTEYLERTSAYWSSLASDPVDKRDNLAKRNFGCGVIDEVVRLGLDQEAVGARGFRLGAEGLLHAGNAKANGTC